MGENGVCGGYVGNYLGNLGVCSAGKPPVVAVVTGSVFQAEAGLVALCHRPLRAGIQQVVVAELIHAVVMPVNKQQSVQQLLIYLSTGLQLGKFNVNLLLFLFFFFKQRTSVILGTEV